MIKIDRLINTAGDKPECRFIVIIRYLCYNNLHNEIITCLYLNGISFTKACLNVSIIILSRSNNNYVDHRQNITYDRGALIYDVAIFFIV